RHDRHHGPGQRDADADLLWDAAGAGGGARVARAAAVKRAQRDADVAGDLLRLQTRPRLPVRVGRRPDGLVAFPVLSRCLQAPPGIADRVDWVDRGDWVDYERRAGYQGSDLHPRA